jgi:ATP-dependent helicase HrpA
VAIIRTTGDSGSPLIQCDDLPINAKRQEIVAAIEGNPVVIIAGETGSGKSTHLPLLCLQAGRGACGVIACTQPRRIAAISLARYGAHLTGTAPGELIGYRVRFQEELSKTAQIAYVTDGILLAEIAADPQLSRYNTIIIDEAHERSLNIDFLLGYLRSLVTQRSDLRVIIASATIDTKLFSRSFNHAPIITVSGRLFSVDIRYKPIIEMWEGESIGSYIECVVSAVREIVATEPQGDLLVFIPTVQDILETVACLRAVYRREDVAVLPLYSRMSIDAQEGIFARGAGRKIVVATNIAETSITVPGIRFVIDTGLARGVRWDPAVGTIRMPVERISRAAADQRAGRCGRVSNGICVRLYSELDYAGRPAFNTPEIRRSNLAGIILQMHHLKLGTVERFAFMQRPAPAAIADGYRQLRELEALDKEGNLTRLGRAMARLPLEPGVACMLLHARDRGASAEVMVIAAALSIVDPRLNPAELPETSAPFPGRWVHPDSDFLTFVTVWQAVQAIGGAEASSTRLLAFCKTNGLSFHRMREWFDVYDQIQRICRRVGGFDRAARPADYAAIHISLLYGLSRTIAVHQENALYRSVRGHDIAIFPGSTLFRKRTEWVLFHEIVETNRVWGRTAAMIRPEWIEEVFPDRCRTTVEDAHYDPAAGAVRARQQVFFDGLPLVKNRMAAYDRIDREAAHAIFIEEALVNEQAGDSYAFLRANRGVRDRIDLAERKLRSRAFSLGDGGLLEFYCERLPGVVSLRDLHRLMRTSRSRVLFIKESDLLAQALPDTLAGYPDTLMVGDFTVAVEYCFEPGSDTDGVTLVVPEALFESAPRYYWEWLLPAHWSERNERFAASTGIAPMPVEGVLVEPCGFLTALRRLYRRDDARTVCETPYLWPRLKVVDSAGHCIDTFRPPLSRSKRNSIVGKSPALWAGLCTQWEREGITAWDFDRVGDRVMVASPHQLVPVPGIRALCLEHDAVSIRVFFGEAVARTEHARAVQWLLERDLAEPLAWALHAAAMPALFAREVRGFASIDELETALHRIIVRIALELPADLPYEREAYLRLRTQAGSRITGAAKEAFTLIEQFVAHHQACSKRLVRSRQKYVDSFHTAIIQELQAALDTYTTIFFGQHVSLSVLRHLPRWCSALLERIDAALLDPGRYRATMRTIGEYAGTLARLRADPRAVFFSMQRQIDACAVLLEESVITQFSRKSSRTPGCDAGDLFCRELTRLRSLFDELEA